MLFLISACGTVKEAFSNQKKNSSDEFLVEKKQPLVMPPSYNELPTPKKDDSNKEDLNNIKILITGSKSGNESSDEQNNNSFEEDILKKIKVN